MNRGRRRLVRTLVAAAAVSCVAQVGVAGGTVSAAGGWALQVAGLPELSIDDVAVDEGDAGTTSFTFTVRLNIAAGAGGVTFDIATSDNTATSAGPNADYTPLSRTGQVIPEGALSHAFTVLVNGDHRAEPDETFFVNVTNVAGAVVVDGQATGTVRNDDIAGLKVVPASGLTTTESGGTDTFTVALTSEPAADVTVGFVSNDLSEATVAPASLVFNAGNWATPQTVTVTGVDDLIVDGPVPFTVFTTVTSTDPVYDEINAPDASGENLDDDTEIIVITGPDLNITTTLPAISTTSAPTTPSPPTTNMEASPITPIGEVGADEASALPRTGGSPFGGTTFAAGLLATGLVLLAAVRLRIIRI